MQVFRSFAVLLSAASFTSLPFVDSSACCDRAQDDINELLHRKEVLWREYDSIKDVARHLKHRLRDLISYQERQWREIEKERVELEQNGLEGPQGEQGDEGPEGDPGQPGDQGRPGKCRNKRMAVANAMLVDTNVCVSSPSGTLLPNCADCTGETFIECNNETPRVQYCSRGSVWNATLNRCDSPSSVINTCSQCSR